MARAVALAERGRATVAPNPLVGCVLVRDGEVVGVGWHEVAGGPHAEVAALSAAGAAARGATAYVSLEPCNHRGRTPPCSLALIEAGLAGVVFALPDPNPVAAGGATRLEAAGMAVRPGPYRDVVERQNAVFVVNVRSQRPHVTLKLAQTAEGSLQAATGRWITGAEARRRVHRLRDRADAVLVGVGTVLADDPRLDVRDVAATRPPPRPVVFDSTGRTPVEAAMVRDGAVIVTTERSGAEWRRELQGRGADIVVLPPTSEGRVDLALALRDLRGLGISSILAEPGAELAGALVASGLVDRLVLHVAGDNGDWRPADCTRPSDGTRWRMSSWRRVGADREAVYIPEEA